MPLGVSSASDHAMFADASYPRNGAKRWFPVGETLIVAASAVHFPLAARWPSEVPIR
jgi:hypothetical protein